MERSVVVSTSIQRLHIQKECPNETTRLTNDSSTNNTDAEAEELRNDFQVIHIPDKSNAPIFSLRKFLAFVGPGFLVSVAYLDPGNLESDIIVGTVSQYKLLWVLLWSTVAGLFIQLLAARLGVVTGKHLAEVCKDEYPFIPRIVLWLAMELAIIGSDIQEVIGSAIAINILSQGTIPLWEGCLITCIDTFTFLFLESYGLRYLEAFFGLLLAIMSGMFGFLYFHHPPNQVDVLEGFVPFFNGTHSHSTQPGLELVGSIIMPHNIYLHSGLVLSRRISRRNNVEVKEAIKYNTIESTLALAVSFVINFFVICVFGNISHSIFDNTDLGKDCYSNGISLRTASTCLTYAFHGKQWIKYVWAIGLLASGQSSTMTGTYAGQFVMEGFLGLKWAKWKRVLLTRTVAMVPCLLLAIVAVPYLDTLNQLINVEQSMLLPFSLLPILFATSTRRIMKKHKNNIILTIIVWIIATILMGVNCFYIISTVAIKGEWYQHLSASIGLLIYIIIILFFIIYPLVKEIRLWRKDKGYTSICCIKRSKHFSETI